MASRQFVPSEYCLRCDICCRFPEATSWQAPFFSENEIEAAGRAGLPGESFANARRGRGETILLCGARNGYRCPGFDEAANVCRIYADRPFDCRLYPFLLVYDELGSRVFLAADTLCPFVRENLETARAKAYVAELVGALELGLSEQIAPGMVAGHSGQVREVASLPRLSRRICRGDLGLSRLVVTARETLAPYYEHRPARLSAHAFAGCYIWQDLFNIYWRIAHEKLLVFAEHAGAAFLLIPPLGPGDWRKALREGTEILRELGSVPGAARIENVDERDVGLLEGDGWGVRTESPEYICDQKALASLAGNRFKGKRSGCNYFEKHNAHAVRPFRASDFPQAARLHRRWVETRRAISGDDLYLAQLETSFLVHHRAMRDAEGMGLIGRVVEAEGVLVAYTFGYPLAAGEAFVVMLEVADLGVKGAAQFTFREFCREMAEHPRINIMDDSGLPNLARVKKSYHPISEEPRFVAIPPR